MRPPRAARGIRSRTAVDPVSNDAVVIRSATAADLSGVTSIYNYYIRTSNVTFDTREFETAAREPWYAQFASTGPHRLLVAARDQAVVGWACSTRLRPRSCAS